MALPKVAVLSLGGTISSTDTGGPGVTPTLTGEALVEDVPEISSVAEVSAASFRQVPGSELTLDDLTALSEEIQSHLDNGASGVVVTQGTDSIEETSFVLDLLIDRDDPVIVTGAMLEHSSPLECGRIPCSTKSTAVVAGLTSSPRALLSTVPAVVLVVLARARLSQQAGRSPGLRFR